MRLFKSFASILAAGLLAAVAMPAAAQVVAPVPIYLSDRNASGPITTNGLCASTGAAAVANGCVVLQSPGTSTVQVTVTGTYTGPLAIQCLGSDYLTWGPASGPVQSVTSATGTLSVSYAGCTGMRVVPTGAITGTANVAMEASATPPAPALDPFARPISGNSSRASYFASLTVTVPTSAGSLAAIEADATNKFRLRYAKICLGVGALQTTAGERTVILFRTTAASSGGSTVTPNVFESAVDAAFGGILRNGAITTTPASPTIANAIGSAAFAFTTAATTTTPQCQTFQMDTWQLKPPTVPPGVASGLAVADLTGGAGGAGVYNIDLGWSVEAQ